jgi:hypothetical protein
MRSAAPSAKERQSGRIQRWWQSRACPGCAIGHRLAHEAVNEANSMLNENAVDEEKHDPSPAGGSAALNGAYGSRLIFARETGDNRHSATHLYAAKLPA